MADLLKNGPWERDVEQAITALKKGVYLLKYGRRGKPKFCPFRLSTDESTLIWYDGKIEKQLKLSTVSKIIPGQRTAVFQRYPRPDKEYQSFSLIYKDRSLDLICKDKDEAEVWFVGLKALISPVPSRKWRAESIRSGRTSSDTNSPKTNIQSSPSPFITNLLFKESGNAQNNQISSGGALVNDIGNAVSDVILYSAPSSSAIQSDSVSISLQTLTIDAGDNSDGRGSAVEAIRVSLSSVVSSSSQGSGYEDLDALGDVIIWGEGIGDGVLGGGRHRVGSLSATKVDASLPKALESVVVLDVQNIACGSRHAALVTRRGEVFSWGEESGGRLGHGVDVDVLHPKMVNALSGINVEYVACGEYHTCAITLSGDLYTWGDGTHNLGLLGHGSVASHWIPQKVSGHIEGLHVSSVSCGPWHTVIVTSTGQMFTFGEGTFGALGHGNHSNTNIPREVEALKGMRTVRAACGVWHTAAIVEITDGTDTGRSSNGRLFTWGDGDKGRLGHGDRECRLLPSCVTSLCQLNFCQVACGNDVTIALTTFGQVYTMGSTVYGLLGNPTADGKLPTCIDGKLNDCFVEEIACGSYHAAVLTSRTEVYTWGRGANGRLGHGDNDNRSVPTLVEALKDKQVKSVVCGSSFTAVICLHKCVSSADQSMCSGCLLPFNFRRKRHNCYNCGLVFCTSCTSRKSLKASLAPSTNKPYRVCDDCYTKLKKAIGDVGDPRKTKYLTGNLNQISNEATEKDNPPRVQGQMSRLSSVDSLKGESKHVKQVFKFDQSNRQLSSSNLNGSSEWGNAQPTNPSNFPCESSKKIFSASVPSSRVASRSTSPVQSKPSPPQLMIAPSITGHKSSVVDGSKQTNDDLSQEVVRLQLQVEELTHKSKLLEAELGTMSRQLQEATATAGEETAKCTAAKEEIKTLAAQLKDMAEKLPEGWRMNRDSLDTSSSFKQAASCERDTLDTANSFKQAASCERDTSSTASLSPESNGNSKSPLACNGASVAQEEAEWVEQVEPGVYITVSSAPGGGKHVKRVCFSRKRFSEKKAEKWWAENRSKLQENTIYCLEKIRLVVLPQAFEIYGQSHSVLHGFTWP